LVATGVLGGDDTLRGARASVSSGAPPRSGVQGTPVRVRSLRRRACHKVSEVLAST
jgi:acetyltransferase-like isoleucine patch superfamily enzyme